MIPPSKQKSRKLRRVFVKIPGGVTKIHYRRRKPKHAKCAICKKPLHGVPRLIPSKFKDLPKSSKKPIRPYSNLCSNCMRRTIIEKIRS